MWKKRAETDNELGVARGWGGLTEIGEVIKWYKLKRKSKFWAVMNPYWLQFTTP